MLINKDFVCHDIQVTVALPESYDFKKAYPVVFLNDGQLEYLGKIADSVILVGLEPQNRLDDFTPWQAQALRPGSPDFGGKLASYHDHLFGHIFKSIAQEFRLDDDCGRNVQRIDDGQNGESGWFSDAVFWLAAGGCLRR